MDIGFYKQRGSRGMIKHQAAAAMPAFYPGRSPAAVVSTAVAPASAPWPAPAPPPSAVTVEAASGMYGGVGHAGGGVDADVDRRAAMYISRVQERLRRERMASEEYWRKRY